jgi:hypothetical protein
MKKITDSWKVGASALMLLNLLLLSQGQSFALTNDTFNSMENIVSDGRGPTARSTTTIFSFMASGLCSKVTEQCMEISGTGTVRFNDELKAGGHLIKYKQDAQFWNPPHYVWTAKELVNANAMRVHFKATTSIGKIDIAITEGKTPNSGLVCIWGTLNGIMGPNETLCTNKVTVYIS